MQGTWLQGLHGPTPRHGLYTRLSSSLITHALPFQWSRFSGGSGAPYWTLLACGINPRNITKTHAAMVHCEYPNSANPNPAELPAMIWSTNYGRLVVQTLFTLFYAGRDFAPKCVIDGVNIQDYLQSHYIEAFGLLADRIRDAGDLLDDCIIGWDSLNEPFEGFCGYLDLNSYPSEQGSTLKKGTFPTPAQSFRLGMGQAQTLDVWSFSALGPKKSGKLTVDPKGVKLWSDPSTEVNGIHQKWGWKRDPAWKLGTCLWAQHGIWDVESGYVMIPDYFLSLPPEGERSVVFIEDYWRPHWQAFASRIRRAHPEAILFVAPPVFAPPPPIDEEDLKGRACLSTHYYDGLTLLTRHWHWFNADALGVLRGKYGGATLPAVKIGEKAIRKSLQQQLGILQDDAQILGPYPTIIGEIGIPYDMDDKKAYGWTDNGKHKGDYASQQKALDASLNAADGPNALNYTLWTYCPDNSHAWGDGWNLEDLSIWSPDDLKQRSEFVTKLSDNSSAMLLKKGAIVTTSAATSSLSLSTLPGGDGGVAVDTEVKHAAITSLARWNNAYDFLTDGARAVKAFCRPYPMATVGRPKDIQFDVNKSEFKLTVVVRSDDAPNSEALLPPRSSSSSVSTVSASDKEIELSTEIYIPLVHFASDKVVAQATGESQQQSDLDEEVVVAVDPISHSSSPFTTAQPSRNPSSFDLPASLQSSGNSSATLSSPLSTALSISVKASEGRYTIEGQVLKWWYPVPAEGEPEREYTITISRMGGAIKTKSAKKGFWAKLRPFLCPCCTIM